jgi:hypothetical protein
MVTIDGCSCVARVFIRVCAVIYAPEVLKRAYYAY